MWYLYHNYKFSENELNNEVSRLTSILLCGVPVCVNVIHNVMTTPKHRIKYVCDANRY